MRRDRAERNGTGRAGGTKGASSGGLLTRIVRAMRCFGGADSGATTIEFAMVGVTFTMLLAVIASFGVYFLRLTMLDLAVQKASRLIMIDQSITQQQFLADIKSYSLGFLQGQTINVAVQSASSFAAITPVANISSAGGSFSPGTNGSDVLVQVGYTDNLLQHFLPGFLSNVSSTVAFQIEPAPQ